jgi:predicted RNase H-like HicB family nuclease
MDYIAIIHKDADSDYGVSFPDFPGCITAGENLDEAKDMAIEALNGHIAVMRDGGEPIPAPSSLDTVMAQPDFHDGVAFLVHCATPDKTVRVNITMTERELGEIDKIAAARGMTRSALLVKSGLEMR